MHEGFEKQKTWEELYAVYERVDALKRDIFDKAKALGNQRFIEVLDLYEAHKEKVKTQFDGTILDSAAGHAFVGSSIPKPDEDVGQEWKALITRDDYPGEYSIENFLTRLQETIN